MVAIQPKQFTVADFHRLGELGFFRPDEAVELIRGEIIQVAPKRTPHSVCNSRLVKTLIVKIADQATVRGQEPITLSDKSEPSPDVAIAHNRADEYLTSHPGPDDLYLVIEISDSTLKYDRETKLSVYAEENITHYWIFNLVEAQLETYSEPYQDNQGNFSYRVKRVYLSDESVNLPGLPDISIKLSEIFPAT
ncbi:MAG: Uma2 family endonuclease [Cyanobacteria bacterium P01_F01_bin.4]